MSTVAPQAASWLKAPSETFTASRAACVRYPTFGSKDCEASTRMAPPSTVSVALQPITTGTTGSAATEKPNSASATRSPAPLYA